MAVANVQRAAGRCLAPCGCRVSVRPGMKESSVWRRTRATRAQRHRRLAMAYGKCPGQTVPNSRLVL